MDSDPNSIPPTPPLSRRERRAAQLCHLAIAPKLLVQTGLSLFAGAIMVETWVSSQRRPTGYEILGYLLVAVGWPVMILLSEVLLGFLLTIGIRALAWPKTEAETPFVDHYRSTTQRFHNRIAQRILLSVVIFFLLLAGWCGVSSGGGSTQYLEPSLLWGIAIALPLFGLGLSLQLAVLIQGLRHASRGDRYHPPWTT